MKTMAWTMIVLLLASVGPLIFPIAESGHGNLSQMALRFLLPSVALLAILAVALRRREKKLSRLIASGAVAGTLATIPLEVVRLIGFHYDFMPGNLPRLMGVLLLNRFMLGPSSASDIAGWAYHFWNGAAFGVIYAVVIGTRRRWLGALYGILVGVGFMLSPVVVALGVGYFGLQFSHGFPATVLLAHIAFGTTLGFLAYRFTEPEESIPLETIRTCLIHPKAV